MKKKLIAMILGTALCAVCLTACGPTADLESPIIHEEESVNEITEETEDVENEKNDVSDEDDKLAESDESATTDSEGSEEDTDNKDNKDSANNNSDESDETDEEKPKDPYAGLAVAHCHNVTLPMGTSYNDAIAEVTKGTSAYPDTFPNIYGANLDVPGVYTCFWEQKQEDGTWLPLNYAVFTVTIYDPNPPVIAPPVTNE